MSPAPDSAARHRPAALTVATLAALAVAGAVLPVLAGLAFLTSLATPRPLIATAARRWPWLSGRPTGQQPGRDQRVMNGLTAMSGIAMLAAGAAQGVGAGHWRADHHRSGQLHRPRPDRPGRRGRSDRDHHRLPAPQPAASPPPGTAPGSSG
jgi:hypothetical protein